MCKKFIIENHENSQSFAILYLYYSSSKGRELGYLKFYSVYGEGELHEAKEEDFEKGTGWSEIAEKLIQKAQKLCEENGAILWSY